MGLFSKILAGNTLYYPGCSTKFVAKDVEKKYIDFLNKMSVDFITLSEIEKCCGSPILNAGYKDDFKKLAQDNLKLFKEQGISKIITNCPGCYLQFKKVYPEYLGDDCDIEVEYLLLTIWKAYKAGKIKFAQKEGVVTYHDPCHLGRAMGIYEEPREILKLSGYDVREMKFNREYALCCGAGGTVNINDSDLSSDIADDRIKMAKETNADFITSPCVLCAHQLGNHSDDEIKTKEFSKLIDLI